MPHPIRAAVRQGGGNDAGLISVAEKCAELDLFSSPFGTACKNYYNSGGSDPNVAAINATGPKVVAAIQGIHQRASQAKVIVVGYPDGLPVNGIIPTSAAFPLHPNQMGEQNMANQVLAGY